MTILPDSRRVVTRFFTNSEERTVSIIRRVLDMSEDDAVALINQLLREFSSRHRNITRIFERYYERLKPVIETMGVDQARIDMRRRLLIGAYFSMEYSIESAGFFNPSMVEDIDQSDLAEGEKRVIISFRAVGEGHISSIVFRRAVIDQYNDIRLEPQGNYVDEPEIYRNAVYNKHVFFQKTASIHLPVKVVKEIIGQLRDEFEYSELKKVIREVQQHYQHEFKLRENLERVLWLANSYYDIRFSLDTGISDRVIFPYSDAEQRGIEDARFVKFRSDNGEAIYYATYTAFDGTNIQPKLLETKDFYHFRIMPLHGAGAQNKNLAIFPRKINGRYAMFSRIDGINNYLVSSTNLNVWEHPVKIQEPRETWSYVQIGNCGSPIETEAGWLLITHGVGPMRKYALSASLFDLEDPSKELGRLKQPLLIPSGEEREGYVPNVVYSCGSIIHNDELIIPYGISDYATRFATVPVRTLLEAIVQDGGA